MGGLDGGKEDLTCYVESMHSLNALAVQVRSYEQFISYLLAKDPGHIKAAQLSFEGRNTVIYCTSWGPDFS